MNTHTAYADFVTTVPNPGDRTSFYVLSGGQRVGHVCVIRGFMYYTGIKRTCHEGVKAVIGSRGSDHGSQIADDLLKGIRSGRDDRS